MPRNVNGIGTTYYGASDRQPDKSFVTTEWFILFSVPLVPLRAILKFAVPLYPSKR